MEDKYPRIALQGIDGLIFIHKQEILYATADGNYTHVYLTKNRCVKVPRKLKEVSQLLSNDVFIRIHRSHFINLEHVIKYSGGIGSEVLMSNDTVLPVSRNRKAYFIEKFTRI